METLNSVFRIYSVFIASYVHNVARPINYKAPVYLAIYDFAWPD